MFGVLRRQMSSVALRDYQKEAIRRSLSAWEHGVRKQVVSLPVGAGKTVVFSGLIGALQPPPTLPTATKTLVLAHRVELLEQAAARVAEAHPDLCVEIEAGPSNASQRADVVVGSVPTLGRAGDAARARLEYFDPHEFKLVVVDEAHHATAPTYARVLDHFGVGPDKARSQQVSHTKLWGCSATIRRHDGLGLGSVFDAVTYHRSMLDMMHEQWLAPMQVFTVKTNTDLSAVSSYAGDFATAQLAAQVNRPDRNAILLHRWHELVASHDVNVSSTLVFAVDVQHIVDLTQTFLDAGIDARGVHGLTPPETRRDLVNAFRAKEFPVLINCGVFTEGTDIPSIDCVILARPTKSAGLFQQMIGRGLRTYPGKSSCVVLDVVDSFQSRAKKQSLVTLPTLLGLSPDFAVEDGADFTELAQAIEPLEDLPLGSSAREAASLDELLLVHAREMARVDPFDPSFLPKTAHGGKSASIEADSELLFELSPNAWTKTGVATFELSLGTPSTGSLHIVCDPESGVYTASQTYRVPNTFISKTRDLPIVAETLGDAVRAADTYVRTKYPGMFAVFKRHAPWRNELASPAQQKFLVRLGYLKTKSEADLAALTKGQAQLIISRIKQYHADAKTYGLTPTLPGVGEA